VGRSRRVSRFWLKKRTERAVSRMENASITTAVCGSITCRSRLKSMPKFSLQVLWFLGLNRSLEVCLDLGMASDLAVSSPQNAVLSH
jgi:hypothetical protein